MSAAHALPEHLQAYLDPEPWLSVNEACRRANMHPRTVYRMADRGKITLFGLPGHHRVKLSQLLPPVVKASAKHGSQDTERRSTASPGAHAAA